MVNEATIRPRPGDNLVTVVIGAAGPDVLSGKVLFDRGRGVVVEVSGKPSWAKGDSMILIFSAEDAVYTVRGRLVEVLTDSRCYVHLVGIPIETEKREFIRAELMLPVSLDPFDGSPGEFILRRIELSASGFRMQGRTDFSTGSKVVLRIRDEDGRTIIAPAEIVRNTSTEIAGRFLGLAPEDRDAILRMVFTARYRELGIEGEPVP